MKTERCKKKKKEMQINALGEKIGQEKASGNYKCRENK